MTTHGRPPAKPRRCPICGRGLTEPSQRFCSDRCAQVDLGRWLGGAYAIPAEEEDPPREE